jgi:nucleosome assembly protein 1-like 1
MPIYTKTQEIVQGRIPTEEELKDIEKYLKDEEKPQLEGAKKEEPIAEYWLKAMKSNDILA